MPLNIHFDASQFLNNLSGIERILPIQANLALKEMADTLLLLSREEVPHDEGTLQGSGNVQPEGDDWLVAYDTAYASYQHEGVRADGTHRISHYQKGRKGKYLEDPLKMNMSKWGQIFASEMGKILK